MTNEEAILILEKMMPQARRGDSMSMTHTKMTVALSMAIVSLQKEPKWIPISERLPKFNDIVLASSDSDYPELRVILTVYSAEEFWFNGKIKAWMPLPEPYKEESEVKDDK